MRSWSLSELAVPLEGHHLGADCTIAGVSTDSRSISSGDLFVALRGDDFDGHDYLRQAERGGAAAVLVSADSTTQLPVLRVTDTQKALGLLGAYNRLAFDGTLVAITGSGGKTTVKNMVYAVLSQCGSTLATAGNFNNEIGVPLTLLELAPQHQFAVVEMGAARVGDISWLATLGQPSVAVLLNALPAHLEGFGGVEQVARAKGEIFEGLAKDDVAIINADQPWAAQWRASAGDARIIDFSLGEPAAVSAVDIQCHGLDGASFTALAPLGDFPVNLQIPGIHNVANALAAIAVGVACDLSIDQIQQGLASVSSVAGRLVPARANSGAMVIDDCYNANPESVKVAIDVLAQCGGVRTLVLGAMKELGPASETMHIEVANYAKATGIDQLWGVGEELCSAVQAFGSGGRYFSDREAAIDAVVGTFSTADTVLVKGSRGVGMETVLNALSVDKPDGGH